MSGETTGHVWARGTPKKPLVLRLATTNDVAESEMDSERLRWRAMMGRIVGSRVRPVFVATLDDGEVLCSPMGAVALAKRHGFDAIIGW